MEKLKIQYLNIDINFNQWTNGRWAIPKPELWHGKIDHSCNIVCFPIQKYNYKRKFNIKKICKCCGREFTPNSNKQTMCGFCFDINTCDMCGKIFITQHKNEKSDKIFCSHECSRKFSVMKMNQWYKNHPEKRTENAINMHKNYSGMKYCKICGKETYHLVGVGCIECHNKTESKRNSSKIYMENLWKNEDFKNMAYHMKYCKICGCETIHKFFTCLRCNPEAMGATSNRNFIIKNNVKFYKDEPVDTIIQKLENHEYDVKDFPGWNKRFDRWCYGTYDILIDEKLIYYEHNFTIQKEILYYFDKSIENYIPWKEYKEKFKTKIELNNSFVDEIKLMYPNAFIQTTFRIQDSDNWVSARQAFEQDLVNMNINWFVYIKFYFNKENKIKPLVVGKSGSLNVNVNGSDVSFSTDINDGPARKFLNDENLQWCKTQILIIPCENENKAYNVEKFIFNKFNLFQS